jgi:hypothetical protein
MTARDPADRPSAAAAADMLRHATDPTPIPVPVPAPPPAPAPEPEPEPEPGITEALAIDPTELHQLPPPTGGGRGRAAARVLLTAAAVVLVTLLLWAVAGRDVPATPADDPVAQDLPASSTSTSIPPTTQAVAATPVATHPTGHGPGKAPKPEPEKAPKGHPGKGKGK